MFVYSAVVELWGVERETLMLIVLGVEDWIRRMQTASG